MKAKVPQVKEAIQKSLMSLQRKVCGPCVNSQAARKRFIAHSQLAA